MLAGRLCVPKRGAFRIEWALGWWGILSLGLLGRTLSGQLQPEFPMGGVGMKRKTGAHK